MSLAVAEAPSRLLVLKPVPSEGAALVAKLGLLALIRDAVSTGDEREIAGLLKDGLVRLARTGGLTNLPYPAVRSDRYSRGLVYEDPWCRFSVIAMTWPAGLATPLHDHCGAWCVEVVVEGEMEVTNYQLLSENAAGLCRFERRETIPAHPASSGALLPPFEHHVFANVGSKVSRTLHVYGGSMSHCDIFEPAGENLWQRRHRGLRYDA